MSETDLHRRFTPEEVQKIIGRAAELNAADDRLGYDDMVDIAAQVCVDGDAVAAAIEQRPTPPSPPAPVAVPRRTVVDDLLACLCLRPLEPRPLTPPAQRA